MKHLVIFLAGLCLVARICAAADQAELTAEQRLDPAHLRAAHADRERFARERRAVPAMSLYEDFRAVLHVHAEDSEHTGERASRCWRRPGKPACAS